MIFFLIFAIFGQNFFFFGKKLLLGEKKLAIKFFWQNFFMGKQKFFGVHFFSSEKTFLAKFFFWKKSVQDGPRDLLLKFGKHRVSNS